MAHRRLVIDGQIFQTPAWHRGMGKYSMALLIALGDFQAQWDSIEILLSNHLPKDANMLKQLGSIKAVKIVELSLRLNHPNNSSVVAHNRKAVDNYLQAETNQPIDFLILSLFQREICPVFPTDLAVQKLLIFYDLVPLMFHQIYLTSPASRDEYLTKFTELFLADKYLAISKTVANDLALYLGIDSRRIVSIDGGPIDHSDKQQAISVPRPFILMPTGNDFRKNNTRGIQGFERFNHTHGSKYSLVITSFFNDSEVKQLSSLSDNLVFTGNVSGEQLEYLYHESEALLFPTEYEGLGLPILEAVINNKPVVCSNISVFREMSEEAFYYFDPYSVGDIALALTKMIKTPQRHNHLYAEIINKYTWQETAHKIIAATRAADSDPSDKPKPRIALFAPDPSGLPVNVKYIQTAYAELTRLLDIDFYLGETSSQTEQRTNFLPYAANAQTIKPGMNFRRTSYDECIYNIGNNVCFSEVLFSALGTPGIIVLQDAKLEEAWRGMVKKGLIDGSRFMIEQQLSQAYLQPEANYLVSLLAHHKAIIVFSERHKQIISNLLAKLGSAAKIYKLNVPTSSLVYPEILPQRTCNYVGLNEQGQLVQDNQIISQGDLEFNDQLAKTKALVVTKFNQLDVAFNAMALGVLPASANEQLLQELPKDLVIKYDNQKMNHQLSQIVDSQTEKQAIKFGKLHSYATYAAQLVKIMEDING